MTPGIAAAFLLGLWGSLHCVGMCGGIVGVLHNSLSEEHRQNSKRRLIFWLAYNSGRIFSYSLAGAIAALFGSSLLNLVNPQYAQRIGLFLSGAFMIAFGLYLAGWWQGLMVLERKGTAVWRHISPITQHFVPVERVYQAFLIGALWGWLPCGLVYSALVWALTLPNMVAGMFHMVAFGLGTLPMLLLMGSAAGRVSRIAQNSRVRKLAGTAVILFGVATFIGISPLHTGHQHDGQPVENHEHAEH